MRLDTHDISDESMTLITQSESSLNPHIQADQSSNRDDDIPMAADPNSPPTALPEEDSDRFANPPWEELHKSWVSFRKQYDKYNAPDMDFYVNRIESMLMSRGLGSLT
jgi:hypothetical protein